MQYIVIKISLSLNTLYKTIFVMKLENQLLHNVDDATGDNSNCRFGAPNLWEAPVGRLLVSGIIFQRYILDLLETK